MALYDIHTGILYKDYDDSSPVYLTENDTCMAPTLSLVAKWLRKEKNIHINPEYRTLKGVFCYAKINGHCIEDDFLVRKVFKHTKKLSQLV